MDDIRFRISVPGKAMLWGEFGVLWGGSAVVVTIPAIRFLFEFAFSRATPTTNGMRVESSFFESGELKLTQNDIWNSRETKNPEAEFFLGLCFPWREVFAKWSVDVRIVESFAPSLGFGSSSAIIIAMHRAFSRVFWGEVSRVQPPLFWERIFDALKIVQGGGSGYDVCAQNSALSWSEGTCEKLPRVWEYARLNGSPSIHEIEIADIRKFGVLISSRVYSSTANALQEYRNSREAAMEHAAIASAFLNEKNAACVPELMRRSVFVARQQGIVPQPGTEHHFAKVCDALDKLSLPWKHMGSGGGDCIWILATRDMLECATHPVSGNKMSAEVVFDFEKIGDSQS